MYVCMSRVRDEYYTLCVCVCVCVVELIVRLISQYYEFRVNPRTVRHFILFFCSLPPLVSTLCLSRDRLFSSHQY